MRYFDEERNEERLANTPYILPGFYVRIEDEEHVYITVWLQSASNAFSSKSITIHRDWLPVLFEKYVADPEATLKELFSWTPRKTYSQELSLEDLGL